MREGKNKMMSTQMESYLAFLPKIGERQKSIVEVLEGKAMTALDGAGYKTAVCYSFEEARRTIEDYVK